MSTTTRAVPVVQGPAGDTGAVACSPTAPTTPACPWQFPEKLIPVVILKAGLATMVRWYLVHQNWCSEVRQLSNYRTNANAKPFRSLRTRSATQRLRLYQATPGSGLLSRISSNQVVAEVVPIGVKLFKQWCTRRHQAMLFGQYQHSRRAKHVQTLASPGSTPGLSGM